MRVDPVAFLGPAGTFTEEALMSQPDLAAAQHAPMTGVFEIVSAIETGKVACGVAPIENSIEGSVNATLDALAFDSAEIYIEREIVLKVDLNLIGAAGTDIGAISEVLSHPHAIAQCRQFLASRTPGAEQIATISTADGARQVAESGGSRAAIGTKLAASLYGLEILEEEVSDYPGNATRFVLLGTEIPPPSGHDKTSIVCFQDVDRPGSLLGILQEFAARAINLTKIESRPTKTALGDYCFVIDFEGHISDQVVADAMVNLKAKLANLRFLGSYPSAAGEAAEIRAERGAAYESAVEFVDAIRERVSR